MWRCFYCSESNSGPQDDEHVLPAAINASLVTKRVCTECNRRAGREVDRPWLTDYLVKEARVRLRVPDRRDNTTPIMRVPVGEIDRKVIVTLNGADGTTRFKPVPRDVVEGETVTLYDYSDDEVRTKIERLHQQKSHIKVVETRSTDIAAGSSVVHTHTQSPDVWPRFGAKVALALASLVVSDEWLDSDEAKELQKVLWNGAPESIDSEPGYAWCPLPHQLTGSQSFVLAPEHLLAFEEAHGEQWLVMVLFGELLYRIPLSLDWGEQPPQSWWFSPESTGGRRLPGSVQYLLLNQRLKENHDRTD